MPNQDGNKAQGFTFPFEIILSTDTSSYHKLVLTRAGDGEGSLLLFSNNTINLTLRKC